MPKPTPPPSNPLRIAPKLAFLADAKRASAHSDTMASPIFHAAANAALLQYQLNLLPGGSEPTALAACSLRLSGAKGFLDLLMNLGIPDAPRAAVRDPNALVPPEEFWSAPTIATDNT